ncbi:MAG: hypothetical protein ABI912_12360 [Actinomycetota bacterium]
MACQLLAAQNGIPHAGGKLRLEVIALAAANDNVERQNYLALYDAIGTALYTSSRIGGLFVPFARGVQPGFTGISVDRAGRVFVAFGTGAHSSFLVVLDPGVRPVRTFGTLPGDGGEPRFFTDTPSSGALDVDGDGINELVSVVNDYDPNYAQGTSTALYYKYEVGDFQAMGCTTLTANIDLTKPPRSAPASKACKMS